MLVLCLTPLFSCVSALLHPSLPLCQCSASPLSSLVSVLCLTPLFPYVSALLHPSLPLCQCSASPLSSLLACSLPSYLIYFIISYSCCTFAVYRAHVTSLNRPPSLKDLESVEPAFYNSLLWIQQNDPEPLDLTFTVEEDTFGQLTTHELKPGGLELPVTDQNKLEYVDLMVRWRMENGVTEQMSSFMKGFNEVTACGAPPLHVTPSSLTIYPSPTPIFSNHLPLPYSHLL